MFAIRGVKDIDLYLIDFDLQNIVCVLLTKISLKILQITIQKVRSKKTNLIYHHTYLK